MLNVMHYEMQQNLRFLSGLHVMMEGEQRPRRDPRRAAGRRPPHQSRRRRRPSAERYASEKN